MSHCTAEGVIDAQPKKFDGGLHTIKNLMGQQWRRSEIVQSGLGVGITIAYGRARVGVSPYCTVRPGCEHHHSVWSGWVGVSP